MRKYNFTNPIVYGIQTSFKTYRALCKVENIVSIDRYVYFAICGEFMLFLSKVLLDGFKIRFPERLGTMQVIGNKQVIQTENGISHNRVDWRKTNDLWARSETAKTSKKLVYYTNEHSKGFIYKLKWFKKNAVLINKSIYHFVPSKIVNRKLAKEIRNNKEYLIMNKINSIATNKGKLK